ncbi:hypothetical protein PpBr36_02674 [Pyricularia pennisetigena]|uniref:hypothetical protein n=1 Tax=Pyricularia pennisetigena TaxID=1578925 RepID=UPI001153D718|nr:hypothetical protein PpBr36_02674 [Pyricularia pennisetigena]TLS30009.1 hypothetical protein PpBr36_02674 [Pyricularia pennisetigena]
MSAVNTFSPHEADNQALVTVGEPGSDLRGMFMWLPPYDKISPENHATFARGTKLLDPGAYNHPVVVLSTEGMTDGTVMVLMLTSMDGHTLEERYAGFPARKADRMRKFRLPIAPAEAHGPHNIVLFTSQGHKLEKISYVKTDRIISVRLCVLRQYGKDRRRRRGPWAERLSKSSLETLARYVHSIDRDNGRPLLTRQSLPSSVSALENPRRVERTAVAVGYGTLDGGRGSLPPYNLAPSRVNGRQQHRYPEYVHTHSYRPPSSRDSPGFMASLRRLLMRGLRDGWAAAKNAPWDRLLPLLFFLVSLCFVVYGVYSVVVKVVRVVQAVIAALKHKWAELWSARSWHLTGTV